MSQNQNFSMARAPKKKQRLDNVTKGLLVAFAVIGILLAYFGGKFVFSLVKSWSLTALPGAPVQTTTDANSQTTDNSQQSNNSTASNWDGKSRVNILLMGLDYSTERAARNLNENLTDTMILVTIDPMSQTIGALSIRRDLWVNIPEGFGYDKINTAYSKGLHSNLPGVDGPGLAMETVENFLGINIDYYAIVNLDTFVKLIDEIQGVQIEVKSPMLLDWSGTGQKFWIQPGIYTMPGQYALAYARCRTELESGIDCGDTTGDIGRGARQMEMIQSIRNRILDFNMLPTLISHAPALYQDISSGVSTNMTLDQAIQLLSLMTKIPKSNMTTYNIDYTMASPQVISFNGAPYSVLVPFPEKVRVVRDQMFAASGSAAAPIALGNSDTLSLALQENARIQVLNGSVTSGLAETAAESLKAKGLNVVSTGNTDSTPSTTITIVGATPYTAAFLQNLLAVNSNQIVYHVDTNAEADIIIYLGNDFTGIQ